jgi:hypothetical protein
MNRNENFTSNLFLRQWFQLLLGLLLHELEAPISLVFLFLSFANSALTSLWQFGGCWLLAIPEGPGAWGWTSRRLTCCSWARRVSVGWRGSTEAEGHPLFRPCVSFRWKKKLNWNMYEQTKMVWIDNIEHGRMKIIHSWNFNEQSY